MLAFSLFLSCIGCDSNDVTSAPRKSVEIHLPEDDTVNGYRNETASKEAPTVSNATSITASSETSPSADIQYCANINTKVFHLKSCTSATNMKEENKYFLSDRDALIADGYKPCGRCNP